MAVRLRSPSAPQLPPLSWPDMRGMRPCCNHGHIVCKENCEHASTGKCSGAWGAPPIRSGSWGSSVSAGHQRPGPHRSGRQVLAHLQAPGAEGSHRQIRHHAGAHPVPPRGPPPDRTPRHVTDSCRSHCCLMQSGTRRAYCTKREPHDLSYVISCAI